MSVRKGHLDIESLRENDVQNLLLLLEAAVSPRCQANSCL